MPIRPTPTLYRCPQCGWKKTFSPKSDALMEYPPDACGKCGHPDLRSTPASTTEAMLGKLYESIKKIARPLR